MVGDKASGRERSERKESSVNSARDRWRGTEKNQRSEEGALVPVRKGWGS